MCYQHGMKIGFFRGDVKLLTEDLMALRPTIFPTVPRLLNRIYDKVYYLLMVRNVFFPYFIVSKEFDKISLN